MKRIITIILLIISSLCHLSAQNSIDKMVEQFSTVGDSKFTSVVDRDPSTHKIQKVVKILQVDQLGANKFVKAFRNESKNGTYSEEKKDGELVITLYTKGEKSNRVYVLSAKGGNLYYSVFNRASVTIIVKVNK